MVPLHSARTRTRLPRLLAVCLRLHRTSSGPFAHIPRTRLPPPSRYTVAWFAARTPRVLHFAFSSFTVSHFPRFTHTLVRGFLYRIPFRFPTFTGYIQSTTFAIRFLVSLTVLPFRALPHVPTCGFTFDSTTAFTHSHHHTHTCLALLTPDLPDSLRLRSFTFVLHTPTFLGLPHHTTRFTHHHRFRYTSPWFGFFPPHYLYHTFVSSTGLYIPLHLPGLPSFLRWTCAVQCTRLHAVWLRFYFTTPRAIYGYIGFPLDIPFAFRYAVLHLAPHTHYVAVYVAFRVYACTPAGLPAILRFLFHTFGLPGFWLRLFATPASSTHVSPDVLPRTPALWFSRDTLPTAGPRALFVLDYHSRAGATHSYHFRFSGHYTPRTFPSRFAFSPFPFGFVCTVHTTVFTTPTSPPSVPLPVYFTTFGLHRTAPPRLHAPVCVSHLVRGSTFYLAFRGLVYFLHLRSLPVRTLHRTLGLVTGRSAVAHGFRYRYLTRFTFTPRAFSTFLYTLYRSCLYRLNPLTRYTTHCGFSFPRLRFVATRTATRRCLLTYHAFGFTRLLHAPYHGFFILTRFTRLCYLPHGLVWFGCCRSTRLPGFSPFVVIPYAHTHTTVFHRLHTTFSPRYRAPKTLPRLPAHIPGLHAGSPHAHTPLTPLRWTLCTFTCHGLRLTIHATRSRHTATATFTRTTPPVLFTSRTFWLLRSSRFITPVLWLVPRSRTRDGISPYLYTICVCLPTRSFALTCCTPAFALRVTLPFEHWCPRCLLPLHHHAPTTFSPFVGLPFHYQFSSAVYLFAFPHIRGFAHTHYRTLRVWFTHRRYGLRYHLDCGQFLTLFAARFRTHHARWFTTFGSAFPFNMPLVVAGSRLRLTPFPVLPDTHSYLHSSAALPHTLRVTHTTRSAYHGGSTVYTFLVSRFDTRLSFATYNPTTTPVPYIPGYMHTHTPSHTLCVPVSHVHISFLFVLVVHYRLRTPLRFTVWWFHTWFISRCFTTRCYQTHVHFHHVHTFLRATVSPFVTHCGLRGATLRFAKTSSATLVWFPTNSLHVPLFTTTLHPLTYTYVSHTPLPPPFVPLSRFSFTAFTRIYHTGCLGAHLRGFRIHLVLRTFAHTRFHLRHA